jgi:uncharacterized HAD superfamily protein
MRIGIDLDGVLANFNEAFKELIKAQTGIVLPPLSDTYPDTWDYHKAAGVSPEQGDKMWEYIKTSMFWASLHALPETPAILDRLETLALNGHHIYFITSRSGSMAKFWSELWLIRHGYASPTVLISYDKGPIAKGLSLNVFVDDRPENCADVIAQGCGTRVYLIDAPYNRWANESLLYGKRVKTVGEALDFEVHQGSLKEAA